MEAQKLDFSTFSRQSVDTELEDISLWWQEKAIDQHNGGYWGEVDFFGKPIDSAVKGCVLNTRILWFFSKLAGQTGNTEHLLQAKRSYQWMLSNLVDEEFGGLIWSVDHTGEVVDGKKQTYAQSFGIYALSSYYHLTGDKKALELAMSCFNLIEEHTRDYENGGYVEACSQDWLQVSDYRLSEKDLNYPKSMNTHLHVLEAYTALYRVNPIPLVEEAFRHVLDVFLSHIINMDNLHLKLFFDNEWNDKSKTYSYGHDIEASWLLWEASVILADEDIKNKIREICIQMVDICAKEAIGSKGQVCDDFDFATQYVDDKSYWWVQAEALVGFMNAYSLTSEKRYLDLCIPIWDFIQEQHKDHIYGEWHWLAACDQNDSDQIYKAGFWKAPYHNGRAMMELQKLITQVGM